MPDLSEQIRALHVIREIYAGSRRPQFAETIMRQYSADAAERAILTERTQITQGMCFFRQPGIVRIFLTGVAPGVQARRMAYGYMESVPLIQEVNGWHPGVYHEGNLLYEQFIREIIRPNDRVEIYGHSAGGCVGERIAWRIKTANIDQEVSIDTFGSPMPGWRGITSLFRSVSRRRWMLDGDPAPWIPSVARVDGSVILLAISMRVLRHSTYDPHPERFVHSQGGLVVTPQRISNRYLNDLGDNPSAVINAWVDGNADQLDLHSADTYRLVMERYRENHPDGGEITTPRVVLPMQVATAMNVVIPFPLPGQTTDNVVMPFTLRPDGIVYAPDNTAVGNFTKGDVEMAFLKINPRHAFKKVKVGPVWKVMLDGQIILTCDEKYTPGSIVKRGNSFLRALGTHNTVFITDLADALSQWMIAAASNDDFARPLLKVSP